MANAHTPKDSKSTVMPESSNVKTTSELLGSCQDTFGKQQTLLEDNDEKEIVTHASLNVDMINSINERNSLNRDQGLEYMTDLKKLTEWQQKHDQQAYAGITILARSRVLSDLCGFRPPGSVHPIVVSKKENVIHLVASLPDDIIGDAGELQLAVREHENVNDTFTESRELIYHIRQRRINEDCRLIVIKEKDSKYDSAPVNTKCQQRRSLDRTRLNSRLTNQFAMVYLTEEKPTVFAVKGATMVNKVLYWQDATLLGTDGSHEWCEKLISDFCIWLSQQKIPDASIARLEYGNLEIKLFIDGAAKSSYKKPTMTESPELADAIDQAYNPLFTIVCEEGRIPANLTVYNAHILYMSQFKEMRKDAVRQNNRMEKVLFLTSQDTFESIKDKRPSWYCYDAEDSQPLIPKGFRVEYAMPDLVFTPSRDIVFSAKFFANSTPHTCQIKIENTCSRALEWRAIVSPTKARHINISHKSAALKPNEVSLVTVTCNAFVSDDNDNTHHFVFKYLSANGKAIIKKIFINYI